MLSLLLVTCRVKILVKTGNKLNVLEPFRREMKKDNFMWDEFSYVQFNLTSHELNIIWGVFNLMSPGLHLIQPVKFFTPCYLHFYCFLILLYMKQFCLMELLFELSNFCDGMKHFSVLTLSLIQFFVRKFKEIFSWVVDDW